MGRMWWCNIIGGNKGSISYILWFDTITVGYILLTANLVSLKRGKYETILIVKITEWGKLIDYLGLSIEAKSSKAGKKNVYFFRIGSIPNNPSVNSHITRQYLDKQFNLEPPKLRLCQITKKLDAKIAPHISSALRDLGVIFYKSILSRSPILAGADLAGAPDSFYGTQNKQENTQNNVTEGDIRTYMTVDTDQKYQ